MATALIACFDKLSPLQTRQFRLSRTRWASHDEKAKTPTLRWGFSRNSGGDLLSQEETSKYHRRGWA